MDEEYVVKDGVRYRLVPEMPVDPLLEAPSLEKEEEIELEVVKIVPKVKTPKEYLVTTAQRLANARVNRVLEESNEKRAYERRVGNLTAGEHFFGDGSSSGNTNIEEE